MKPGSPPDQGLPPPLSPAATPPEVVAQADPEEEPGFARRYLLWSGRIGRLSFFLRFLCVSMGAAVVNAIPVHSYAAILCLLYFAVLYLLVVATAKRLHDLNVSHWFSFLIFIPFSVIVLSIIPGKDGWNNYGESP